MEFCNRPSHILRLVIWSLPISWVVGEEVVKREELLGLRLLHCLLGEHFLILRCGLSVLRWRHSELLLVCLLAESWHILFLIRSFPLLWAAVLECGQRLVKLSGWPILVCFVSPCGILAFSCRPPSAVGIERVAFLTALSLRDGLNLIIGLTYTEGDHVLLRHLAEMQPGVL